MSTEGFSAMMSAFGQVVSLVGVMRRSAKGSRGGVEKKTKAGRIEVEIGVLSALGPVPFAESSAPDGEGFGEEGVLEETNEVDGPEATRRNDLGGQVDG